MTDDFGPVPPELEAAADRAAELIRRPEAIEAFNEAAADDRLWREASEDPRAFLESRGLKLPEELGANSSRTSAARSLDGLSRSLSSSRSG
jgi:hypothetical protein